MSIVMQGNGRMETVLSVAEMRAADAYTIAHFTPGRELMYRAAQGVYRSADWRGRVAILAGGGNNGGDGYALAGILAGNGPLPDVFAVSEKLSEDGRFYREEALAHGVRILPFTEKTTLAGYDMLVDCILGTGFHGEVRGPARAAILRINEAKKKGAFVVAVDINSGMNGDTGEAELAVRSDLTVSIGFYKTGLLTPAAARYIGQLMNADIGIVLPEGTEK
ncbi:MAG: NAD(P)H-hydrate epimerase [bacterium]|nr:NAD(P)H-hydrate epimerase [bacterium]